jgi:hypothetical protein
MNLAVLRVEGKDDALKNVLEVLRCKPDTTWKKGESKHRGGKHGKSGFTSLIAEAATPRDMVTAVRRFLTECCAQVVSFPDHGLTAELSVGVTVGDSAQFVASIELTRDDLSMMGSLGLSLNVSAYPTSDELNALPGGDA